MTDILTVDSHIMGSRYDTIRTVATDLSELCAEVATHQEKLSERAEGIELIDYALASMKQAEKAILVKDTIDHHKEAIDTACKDALRQDEENENNDAQTDDATGMGTTGATTIKKNRESYMSKAAAIKAREHMLLELQQDAWRVRKHPKLYHSSFGNREGEDEDITFEETFVTKCYVTQKTFTDNMIILQGSSCQHYFSKDGLEHVTKNQRSIECPFSACKAQLIFKQCKEIDERLRNKIRRQIKEQERLKLRNNRSEVDDVLDSSDDDE